MKKLVRCKLCGYVMEEGDLKDVCPACGVARKMFEPYVDPVEPERRRLLALDIHPVVVHAPQALTFLLMLVLFAKPFLPEALVKQYVSPGIVDMATLLPFTVLGAILTGILDGKTRFRKVGTPLLRLKMIIGAVYLLVTIAMMWLADAPPADAKWVYPALTALSVIAMAACSWLGMIGARLLPAVFVKLAPAKKPAAPAPAPEKK